MVGWLPVRGKCFTRLHTRYCRRRANFGENPKNALIVLFLRDKLFFKNMARTLARAPASRLVGNIQTPNAVLSANNQQREWELTVQPAQPYRIVEILRDHHTVRRGSSEGISASGNCKSCPRTILSQVPGQCAQAIARLSPGRVVTSRVTMWC